MKYIKEQIPHLFSFRAIRQPQRSHEKIRKSHRNISDKYNTYCNDSVLEISSNGNTKGLDNRKLDSNFAFSIN